MSGGGERSSPSSPSPVSLGDLAPRSTAAVRGARIWAVDDRLHPGLQIPARLLLRAEGIASSRIEEIHAPTGEIAAADADIAQAAPPDGSLATCGPSMLRSHTPVTSAPRT